MDQPFEEIKFTYSRREYTLPGSSRFTKLLYASPDAFQERFFSYRENRTELARKETRAILTCAYVRYLMFMESNSLLTKGEKDHLLGLVRRKQLLLVAALITAPLSSGRLILVGIMQTRGQTDPTTVLLTLV